MIGFATRRALPLLAALTFTSAALAQGAEPQPPAPPAPAEPGAAEAPAAPPELPAQPGDGDPEVVAAEPAEGDAEQPSAPPAPSTPPEAPAPAAAPTGAAPPNWGAYPYPPGGAPPPSTPVPEPEADEPKEPAPTTLPHWFGAEIGVRTTLLTHDGFEPFVADSVSLLGQLALAASVTPLKFAPIEIGFVPEYNVGAVSHTLRGQESSLALHRLAVGVRVDATITRHLHLYVRGAPAAVYLHGSIRDAAIDRSVVSNGWTWGIDATGGIAVLMGAVGKREHPALGFWLLAEYGYMFAGKKQLDYAPAEDDDDPRRFGSIELPAVRPGGVINRLSLALSF